MAKWDHDDLVSKHDALIKHYYDHWTQDSMAPSTKKNQPKIIPYVAPYLLVPAITPPFQRISTHKLNADTIVVFIIQNGKALLIEDGADLFPSDALVTQLRLIAEPK